MSPSSKRRSVSEAAISDPNPPDVPGIRIEIELCGDAGAVRSHGAEAALAEEVLDDDRTLPAQQRVAGLGGR